MRGVCFALCLALTPAVYAAIDAYQFDAPEQERRFRALTAELRCPKCQNQNIADSDAPLAADLRAKVYELVRAGNSHAAVVDYMVQRYGDFVTYRPPLKPITWPLWFGPLGLVLAAALLLALWIKRRQRSQSGGAAALSPDERQRLDALLRDYHDDAERRRDPGR